MTETRSQRPTGRRIVIDRPGGYDALQIRQFPIDPPAAGEVRIETTAIGVNFADCVIRMGLYSSAREYVGWPITPGFEFAGTVGEIGADIDDLAVGVPVFGVTRFGGYSSSVVVPRHQVFVQPDSMTSEQAAAFPTVSLTAWYAFHVLARPRASSRLLVHSAAGGVGGALVQIGRAAGCQVAGVVGAPTKVEVARDFGAALVIDKSTEDLWAAARRFAPDGYGAVFDANGAETLRQSYGSLAPEGRLVVYGFHSMLPKEGGRPSYLKLAWTWLKTPRFSPIDLTTKNRSVMGFNLSYLFDSSDLLKDAMDQLMGLVAAGDLRPPQITTYPLAEAGAAHRDLESGLTVGKLVLLT